MGPLKSFSVNVYVYTIKVEAVKAIKGFLPPMELSSHIADSSCTMIRRLVLGLFTLNKDTTVAISVLLLLYRAGRITLCLSKQANSLPFLSFHCHDIRITFGLCMLPAFGLILLYPRCTSHYYIWQPAVLPCMHDDPHYNHLNPGSP